MSMPDQVIKRVNAIGGQEGQGREFRFTNRWCKPYEWTDELPEDNPELQGLLNNDEEMVLYLDISAELPGVELEEDECKYQTVTNNPEVDFCDLANAGLHNAGINADSAVQAVQARAGAEVQWRGSALAEADEDKIIYKIMFDLPDAGPPPTNVNLQIPLGDDRDDMAAGNQPYNAYAPRTTFLQLRTGRIHKSVLEVSRMARMTSRNNFWQRLHQRYSKQ